MYFLALYRLKPPWPCALSSRVCEGMAPSYSCAGKERKARLGTSCHAYPAPTPWAWTSRCADAAGGETTVKRFSGRTGFQSSNKCFLNISSSATATGETMSWSRTLVLSLLLVSLKLRELPAKIPCCCEANWVSLDGREPLLLDKTQRFKHFQTSSKGSVDKEPSRLSLVVRLLMSFVLERLQRYRSHRAVIAKLPASDSSIVSYSKSWCRLIGCWNITMRVHGRALLVAGEVCWQPGAQSLMDRVCKALRAPSFFCFISSSTCFSSDCWKGWMRAYLGALTFHIILNVWKSKPTRIDFNFL